MSSRSDEAARRAFSLAGLVPELAPPFAKTAPVRLPELRNVALTPRVLRVVDHPDFQRLRRVLQLGPAHLVYPGATHTRFEHSLGVFENVRRYLMSLLLDPDFVVSVSEQDLLTALAAGLLHDLGHYPFAHALESLGRQGLETPDHEAVGRSILLGRCSKKPIARLLEVEWGVEPERVARLIRFGPAEQDNPLDVSLASILHSPIDADKMDYLERDSIHLGVPYGRNYDRDRLLSSLAVHPESHGLAVTDKGKVSAEIFIFCRYTMFAEVYWHHAVRSAEAMVERALEDFCRRTGEEPQILVDRLLNHSDEGLVAELARSSPEDSSARRILSSLAGGERKLYKRVLSTSRDHRNEAVRMVHKKLIGLSWEQSRQLEASLGEALAAVVEREVLPDEVILDCPPPRKHRLEDLPVVFSGKSAWAPLAELSHTVRGIAEDFAGTVARARLFLAPGVTEKARASLGREGLAERMLDWVSGLVD